MRSRLRTFSHFIWSLTAVVPLATWAENGNAPPNYQSFPFSLNSVKDRIVPIDLNADGLKDLITSKESLLSIYLQKPLTSTGTQPFSFNKPDLMLELPGKATGWDLDWGVATGEVGVKKKAVRIVAIVDGKSILAWEVKNNTLSEPQILVDNLSGNIPVGAYPLDFVLDINGDQRNDFIVPGADSYSLYLQNAQGDFSGDIRIKSNLWVETTLAVDNNLAAKVGQDVRIPNIRIRDVNGDGIKDLISRANNLLEVFLAKADSSYPLQPSYHFDLNEIEDRLGEPSFEEIDLSNLSSMTRYSWDMRLMDITGDKIDDLIIREAGKVVVYSGTATGMNLDKPQQVLRSSGNVFATLLLDEDEDGLKDLWLLRLEDLSLGQVFVWLALSGSINIEAYIYHNEGDKFARRPHRKKTVSITFPSIFKTIGLVNDLDGKADTNDITRTLTADINGDSLDNDLLVLDEKGIRVHLNTIEEQLSDEDMFLGLIKDIRAKDEFVIDLNEILSNVNVQGQHYLAQVGDSKEDFRLSLGAASNDLEPGSDLLTFDLNNDQHSDIFLLTQRKDDTIKGVLYLSMP